MQYTGERAIPWNPAVGQVMDRHVMRYAWALQFCHGRRVVDLGCGTGYGTFMLSWVADLAVGVDVDVETVEWARAHFYAERLYYQVQDIERGPVHMGDTFVAFEILEHLDRPRDLMDRLEGRVLWSLPIRDGSRYHKHTYTLREAESFGGDLWYQSSTGYIVPKVAAQFKPHNVLGVRE